jgi:tetratricopeptide (TPR) repeat protein
MIHRPELKMRSYPMKAVTRISVSVLTAFFITFGLSYGQNTAEQFLTKGEEYAAQGKFKEAKVQFEKALKVDPFYQTAKLILEVIEDLNAKRIESETVIHFFKGAVYHEKGQVDKAISEYNKAIEIDPTFVWAYVNRGNVYEDNSEYDQAISEYNKALKINSKLAAAYFNRGFVYDKKGEYDKAIADYNMAIKINPKLADAYHNRGVIYFWKGQFDQAISDYTKAIEINPRKAESYHSRGLAYSRKGQFDQAISDYTKAIEINPRYAEVYFDRGLDYHEARRHYDKAIADYTKAIEINPRYAKAYDSRGYTYYVKGNKKKACSDWKRACELGECRNYMIGKRQGWCE